MNALPRTLTSQEWTDLVHARAVALAARQQEFAATPATPPGAAHRRLLAHALYSTWLDATALQHPALPAR